MQGRKDRALLALKRRKLQEGQAERLDGWLLNMQGMVGCGLLACAGSFLIGFARPAAAAAAHCAGLAGCCCSQLVSSCCPSQPQLLNIETTKSQQQLFTALKEGNKAMKEMQQASGGAASYQRQGMGCASCQRRCSWKTSTS